MQKLVAAALILVSACAHSPKPASEGEFEGARFSLVERQGRLETSGSVDGHPAAVRFDWTLPLSAVSSGCFAEPPTVRGWARVPTPYGESVRWPEVALTSAEVGDRSFRLPTAVRVEGSGKCVLTLGSEVLLPYALHFDLPRHLLTVTRSLPKQSYLTPTGSSTQLALELTRDPRGDWPMLPVRLRQAGAELTGPFVLSGDVLRSQLSAVRAGHAGLQEDAAGEVRVLLLELAPEAGFAAVPLALDSKWKGSEVLGSLGAEVWAQGEATVDLKAGILQLNRPPPITGIAPLVLPEESEPDEP